MQPGARNLLRTGVWFAVFLLAACGGTSGALVEDGLVVQEEPSSSAQISPQQTDPSDSGEQVTEEEIDESDPSLGPVYAHPGRYVIDFDSIEALFDASSLVVEGTIVEERTGRVGELFGTTEYVVEVERSAGPDSSDDLQAVAFELNTIHTPTGRPLVAGDQPDVAVGASVVVFGTLAGRDELPLLVPDFPYAIFPVADGRFLTTGRTSTITSLVEGQMVDDVFAIFDAV